MPKINVVSNSIMNTKYLDANLTQWIKARSVFIPKSKSVKEIKSEILQLERHNQYPNYNQRGSLTLVGWAKRLVDLKKAKLPEEATLKDYFSTITQEIVTKAIKCQRKMGKNMGM